MLDLLKNFLNDANITELENKIPSISGLSTISAWNGIQNKIPDVISLVKKTDCDTKACEIEKKLPDHNHYKFDYYSRT